MKDLYSASLAAAVVLLQFLNGKVTTADLTSAVTAADTSSANRAQSFVEDARRLGLLAFFPGEEIWTQRPLIIHDGLLEAINGMTLVSLDGAAMVIPALSGLATGRAPCCARCFDPPAPLTGSGVG